MACKNCNNKKVKTQAPEPQKTKETPYKLMSLINTKKRK